MFEFAYCGETVILLPVSQEMLPPVFVSKTGIYF